MISGDGYFVTKTGSQTLYTRDGAIPLGRAGSALDRRRRARAGLEGRSERHRPDRGQRPQHLPCPRAWSLPRWPPPRRHGERQPPLRAKPGGPARPATSPSTRSDGTAQTADLDTFTRDPKRRRQVELLDRRRHPRKPTTGWSMQANGAGHRGRCRRHPHADHVRRHHPRPQQACRASPTSAPRPFAKQDGNAAGTLLSVAMGGDGTLSGTFSNGSTIPLARLSLGTFTNPEGLAKAGTRRSPQTLNSGPPDSAPPARRAAASVVSGALEASNVDLSQEFTNLIVAQRGFQANARIITTSDQVLQELDPDQAVAPLTAADQIGDRRRVGPHRSSRRSGERALEPLVRPARPDGRGA